MSATVVAAKRDTEQCTPAQRITRSLLGYGVVAGPVYVVVAVVQTLTRAGFDPARHSWSQLANGAPGWIQSVNLILAGLMSAAFAAGLRRALTGGTGSRWAPLLVGAYGFSLVAAGVFPADPGRGFPIGSPEQGAITLNGTLHLAAGGAGFTCLTIAAFVLARRYAVEARPRAAVLARVVGVVLAASFSAMAATGGDPVALIAFTCAIVVTWAWIAWVAVDRYRRV